MAENHGAPETGQLSKAWTRRRRIESSQRVSGVKPFGVTIRPLLRESVRFQKKSMVLRGHSKVAKWPLFCHLDFYFLYCSVAKPQHPLVIVHSVVTSQT